ncbi:SIMPL domain-containing protein [Xylophilus sp. ASV27]|uniref:SIMPL domain-containing protein n=1 Tax=Xylophilus sp. ASV27 TaxID=2795129 RepID=UPI0018EA5A5F|nr:SIMPL domain-containing protein [Xylophilus sp. ASV27]
MTPIRRLSILAAVLACAMPVLAQTLPPPQNVIQLSADAQAEVQQDLLNMVLTTTKEGANPAAVQAQLKTALDAALGLARGEARAGQMDVRTGNFSLSPRYSKEGRIASWQGTAELVLEGRDFDRITSTAGRISTMTLGRVGFGLSREQRLKAEADVQLQAIENFKAKAATLARGFGFSSYTLREVSVNSSDSSPMPVPRMMAMAARAMEADAPVPVEAGKSTVVVNISGSVQLQ